MAVLRYAIGTGSSLVNHTAEGVTECLICYPSPTAKQPELKVHAWRIIHIKATPAKTIGYVEAPQR
jgi:hypothetical protein